MTTIPSMRPVRFFNTTGPCNPWDHYMLPPEERLVGAQLHRSVLGASCAKADRQNDFFAELDEADKFKYGSHGLLCQRRNMSGYS